MGNRATIVIKQSEGQYLGVYLHWAPGPIGLKKLVVSALERVSAAGRFGDTIYAMRILVSQIVGDQWNQELSYGLVLGQTWHNVISGDNENDVYVIDLPAAVVHTYKNGYNWTKNEPEYKLEGTLSIKDFIESPTV